MICPACGYDMKKSKICKNCNYNIEVYDMAKYISARLYNKGLSYINNQYVTQGLLYLEKSILIDKSNIDARNLLGLTLFYLGNVGEALKQWIISTHIKEDDNIANEYIQTVKKGKMKLTKYNEAIVMYNEAIKYINDGNEDMALIRLKKAIFLNQNFLDAHSLMILIYMKQENEEKALYYIDRALKIDANNNQIIRYYKELKPNSSIITNKVRNKDVSINKSRVKSSKKKANILFMSLFILIIVLSTILSMRLYENFFPSKRVLKVLEENELLKGTIQEQLQRIEEGTKKIEELQEDIDMYSLNRQLSDYSKKIQQAKGLVSKNKLEDAAIILKNIDDSILDEDMKEEYDILAQKAYSPTSYKYYKLGKKQYLQKTYDLALVNFEKSYYFSGKEKYSDDVLFYMADIYEKQNNLNKALEFYNKITEEYKDSTAYTKVISRKEKIKNN